MKSISDDDVCSECAHCTAVDQSSSACVMSWPGQANADGYIVSCVDFYSKVIPSCPHCGSLEIVTDGALKFDACSGKWLADEPYDTSGFCTSCERSDFSPKWIPALGG